MPYEQLAKLFHMDASSSRYETNAALAAKRFGADATYRTGFRAGEHELFLAVPHELSLLNEQVLRVERRVSLGLSRLPLGARGALIRDLVINEVVKTNELEDIHSTRRQVSDALGYVGSASASDPLETKRFRELAKLYLGLTSPDGAMPSRPEDIRRIYDIVMSGEPLGDAERPDGRLFRKGQVEVIGDGGKVLHVGVYPEDAIMDALQRMIDLAVSDTIPETYSAIVAHYLFEYTHPFYDGNGRTGRYLLALYLSRPLSVLTTLSLSRTIAENKSRYYRSFRDAENPLNHGELTFFVIFMLESIREAQMGLLERLDVSSQNLGLAEERLGALAADARLGAREQSLLYMLVQVDLFATFPVTSLDECAAHLGLGKQQTRRYLARLEERGLVVASGRPVRVGLSDEGRKQLGVPLG